MAESPLETLLRAMHTGTADDKMDAREMVYDYVRSHSVEDIIREVRRVKRKALLQDLLGVGLRQEIQAAVLQRIWG